MAAPIIPVRGRVYMADVGHGDKLWLVISNNGRNRRLGDLVAVRITTTDKKSVASPTIVELADADPLVGRVLCDDIVQLYRDELRRDVGALTPGTMTRVADGLRMALAL